MFMSYDLKAIELRVQEGGKGKAPATEVQIERFYNKE